MVVTIQILLIAAICSILYFNFQGKTLGVTSVNSLSNKNLLFSKDVLENFYEPSPDSEETVDLSSLGSKYSYSVKYKINEDGLNQLMNFPVEDSGNKFRIVILGDSFTFGQNVNTQDNYPSKLQKLLDEKCQKRFEVLNLGVGGYDIQFAVERFKERGIKYDPDLVIWLIIGDDLMRMSNLIIPKISEIRKELEESGEYERYIKHGRFNPAWTQAREEVIEQLGGEDAVLRLQREYLNEFAKYFKKKLIVATFPYTKEREKNFLKEFVNSRENTIFYDDVPIHSDNTFPDGHPNERGHQIIAKDLFNFLEDHKLTSCN
jgi:lysophospholipase L1-like esterase